MSLSWKRIRIFGLNVGIPLVAFLTAKMNQDRAELLGQHRSEMAICKKCHKLLIAPPGLAFILHMQDVHKIEAEHSYEIVSDIWRKYLKIKEGKQ